MNPELRALLRCRTCLGLLESAPEGDSALRCVGCEASFPIVRGVPRLAGDSYVASFGRQWNRFNVVRDEEDEAVFRAKTGVDPYSLAGRLVLDAGCGGGRYARLLSRMGAKVLGVDLSDAVEQASKATAEFPGTAIIQADLLDLPIVDRAFDLVFSIGVLHHSPDPRRAFAEIARLVKPGGRLAVWLYRKNTPPQEWINSALRAVTTRTPARILEPISAGLGIFGSVPLLNKTFNKVFNFSNHPDWTLRVCDNFDWYAPTYQSHHTVAELRSWFTSEGFTDLRDLRPLKAGRLYDWAYDHDLIIGSGVNVAGTKRA